MKRILYFIKKYCYNGEDSETGRKSFHFPPQIAPKRHTMYYIIVNPASKSGRGRKIWKELEQIFLARNIAHKVIFSKGTGHVTRIVANLTAPDRQLPDASPVKLIILGGDGTVNEALQGIADFDRLWLGYIPTGSSNDLARDLALPKDPAHILETILKGEVVRTLDLGILTYGKEQTSAVRYFAVSSGIGFDAAVCREALASRFKKTLNKIGLGKLTYLSIALKQLAAAKSVSCDIYLDHSETPIRLKRFLFTAFMVHKYEGGGFQFCPTADASDGLLDLCVVGRIPKLVILFALPTAFWGKHYIFPAIRHFTAEKATLCSSAPLWVHTDGEVTRKSDSITIACLKQKLHLMM